MARRQRPRVAWRDIVPPQEICDRARVTTVADGWWRVEAEPGAQVTVTYEPVWLFRAWQAPGAKIGDIGRVVYQTGPSGGHAYFFKEATNAAQGAL